MERVAGRVMQLSERSDGDVELSCLLSFFPLYLSLSRYYTTGKGRYD